MNAEWKTNIIKAVYMVVDVMCAGLSIAAACFLRPTTLPFPINFSNIFFNDINRFRLIFLFWVALVVVFMYFNNLYQARRDICKGMEIIRVVKAVLLSVISAVVVIYALKIQGVPRTIILLASIFMVVSLSLWRVLKRMLARYLAVNGYQNSNILIIGAGNAGRALCREIGQYPHLGMRVAGFLDDTAKDAGDCREPVLGKVSGFTMVAQQYFIHQVFITGAGTEEQFLDLLEKADDLKIAVRVVPPGFDMITCDFARLNIGIIPVLEYTQTNSVHGRMEKRLFDFVGAFAMSILFLPVFAALAVAIRFDSRGAVLYRSKRYGCNGKPFNMYKFRSMYKDADCRLPDLRGLNEADGPIFKMKNDPRVTRVGRFLRRYSLDELPQLFNVLKGDMSLVGPRPLPVNQVNRDDLRQIRRQGIKPGITGLWQIRGRSDVSFERLVKWDIWYINNWSFPLDIAILLQTIPVVLKGKGAY